MAQTSRRGRSSLPRPASICHIAARLEALEARRLLSVPDVWHPVGIGGTGTSYYANVNPLDTNEMYLESDMGEVWHTTDAGVTWDTMDQTTQLRSQAMAGYVHYTSEVNTAYAVTNGVLKKTTDGGTYWETVPGAATLGGFAVHLDVDPSSTNRLVVSKVTASGANWKYWFYFSDDGGATFTQILGHAVADDPYKPWFAGTFWDGDSIYVATNKGLFTTSDGGGNWAQSTLGGIGAGQVFQSFSGSKSGGTTRFWAVTWDQTGFSSDPGPIGWNFKTYFRGLYTVDVGQANWTNRLPSGPHGEAWAGASYQMYPRWVQMADNDITSVWIGGGDGEPNWPIAYKSTDVGDTWTRILKTGDTGDFPGELPNENIQTHSIGRSGDWDWGFGGNTVTFMVLRTDPNIMTWTNAGGVFRTDDGGVTWRSVAADPADLNPAGQATPKHRYYSSTLNETSVWDITFIDAQTIFAASTDVTGIRSNDGGQSWQMPTYTGTYANTYYDSVYDPRTAILYGATSGAHDMYTSWISDGRCESRGDNRIAMSLDKGENWTLVHDFGISHAVKALALDPSNPNVMYAGIVNHDGSIGGIYKTTNLLAGAASTWTHLNSQPSRDLNNDGIQDFAGMHPQRIHVLDDGTVVAVFAPRTDADAVLTPTSGVWISSDGGATWQDRSGPLPPAGTPWPSDSRTAIYDRAGDGGIGEALTWGRNLMPYATMDMTIDPNDPTQSTWFVVDQYYPSATYSNGVIYRTTDRGQTWSRWSYVGSNYASGRGAGNKLWIKPGGKEMFFGSKAAGLWYCEDYTATTPVFERLSNMPFGSVTNITGNPWNPDQIWVTTFGNGIWRADLRESAPVPPVSKVTAQAMSATEVKVSWAVAPPYPTSYRVESSLDGVSGWTPAGTVWNTKATSFLVSGLSGGTKYYFRVVSENEAGSGEPSMTAWARTDSSAGLIANEGFAQSTGSLNGTGSGIGWTGNWVAGSGATVAADSVVPANAPNQAGVNSASISSSASSDAYRLLNTTIGTPGTVLWAAFEAEAQNGGTLTFGDTTNGFGFGTPQYGNFPGFYTVSNGSATIRNQGTSSIANGSDHFFVVRLQFETDKVYVRMFLDPTPGMSYPDNEITSFNGNWDRTFVNTILPNGTNKITLDRPTLNTQKWDEIRLGGTYADVAPKSGIAVPATPTAITTTTQSKSRIDLTWTDNASNEEGFLVEYSTNGSTYTAIDRVPGSLTGTGLTKSYSVTNLAPASSYWFRVAAFNRAGMSLYATTPSSTTTLPAAPTTGISDLAVNVVSGQFTLAWSDFAGESGYLLQYSDLWATPFNNSEPQWTTTLLPANTTTHTFSSLPSNKRYFFRILPFGAGGNAPVSNIVNAVGLPAPSGLSAAGVADTQASLSWTDDITGEEGYAIQRSTDGATWTDAGTAPANTPLWVVSGLSPNTIYHFRIQAFATGSTSPWSAATSGRTFATIPGLSVYEGFNYYADPTKTDDLNGANSGLGWGGAWSTNTDGTRNISSGSVAADNPTIADNLLTTGNMFDSSSHGTASRPLAINTSSANGEILWLSVLVKSFDAVPSGYVQLTDSTGNGRHLQLGFNSNNNYSLLVLSAYTWDFGSRPGANETHLLVMRLAYGANPAPGDRVDVWLDPDPTRADPGAPTWSRTGANMSILAFDEVYLAGSGYSGKHSQWDELRMSYGAGANYSAVVPPKLAASPTALQASAGTNAINLSWTDNSANEQGFHLERSTDQSNWNVIQTLPAGATSYADSAVSPGVTDYYRVSSFNSTGDSMPSNIASAVLPVVTVSYRINDGSAQRSMITQITLTFDQDVLLDLAAISLLTRSGGQVPGVEIVSTRVDSRTYRLTFNGSRAIGGSLPDGLYRLSIAGASPSLSFHRLFGDSDGDRDVDKTDVQQFRQALNSVSRYRSEFDYDADGLVTLLDYRELQLRMNRRLL